MPRQRTADKNLTAMRGEIAELARSISRIEAELSHTRAALESRSKPQPNEGNGSNDHHAGEEAVAGAMKVAGEAAGVAEEAIQAGASWLDDMLRKNPTSAVLTALGVGFVLGVMGRR